MRETQFQGTHTCCGEGTHRGSRWAKMAFLIPSRAPFGYADRWNVLHGQGFYFMSTESTDWARLRHLMRLDLERRGIRDTRVLAAMERVPRERFVLPADRTMAYSDQALPIECGQTISQPYMVALMTEVLQLKGDEHVLEIGTGSGYQTALLAELAYDVVSIERWPELSARAAERLAELGYRNVELRVGDGSLGAPDRAPFDRILITAAAQACPPALWEQLREGGILVGPFGDREEQWLESHRKIGGKPVVGYHVPCRFVPFVMRPVAPKPATAPGEQVGLPGTNGGPAAAELAPDTAGSGRCGQEPDRSSTDFFREGKDPSDPRDRSPPASPDAQPTENARGT